MRSLQQLSQNDTTWKDTLLGNSKTVTLGQAGCYVTSFCVTADYFGQTINPYEMNQKLKDANLFVNEDYISNDNDLQVIFPNIKYVASYHYEAIPADLNLLKALLADESKIVILEIEISKDSVHFTPALDTDGNRVTIMNVWDGKVEDFGSVYGDPKTKILKFVVYQGTVDPLVCDKKSVRDMLVTKATSIDTVGNYLKVPADQIAAPGFGDVVVKRIQALEANQVKPADLRIIDTTTTTSNIGATVTPAPTNESGPAEQAKANLFQAFLDYFFTKKGVNN